MMGQEPDGVAGGFTLMTIDAGLKKALGAM
jgi:hypothetical protein